MMNMDQATKIVSAAVDTMEPKVAEAIARIVTAWSDKYDALFLENQALTQSLLDDTYKEFVASRALDRVELAEIKARMENKRLREEVKSSRQAFKVKRKEAKVLANACRKHKVQNSKLVEALEEIIYHRATTFTDDDLGIDYEQFTDELQVIARKALEG